MNIKNYHILIGIISLLIVVLLITAMFIKINTSVQWTITYGNFSTQAGRGPYGVGESLKMYFNRCFALSGDQFFFTAPIRKELEDGQEQEIISALHSAKYQLCEVVTDDYEYVEFASSDREGNNHERVVLAYRLSNGQLYALYKDYCYHVTDYDDLKDTINQFLNIPKEKHYVSPLSEVFWFERFFFIESGTNQSTVIQNDFIYSDVRKELTKEDIGKMAVQEIEQKVSILFATEEHRNKYTEIKDAYVYYDKYTDMWMVQILVYYPVNSEADNDFEGVGATYIDVFIDGNGVTRMIYDVSSVLTKYSRIIE